MPLVRSVVTGAWIAAEIVLKRLVEVFLSLPRGSGAERVEVSTADFRGLPFLGRALASGHLPRVTIRLQDVVLSPVTYATVTLDLEDVQLDAAGVLRRDFRIARIGRGTVTTELTPGRLSALVASVLERSRISPQVDVREGALFLRASGLPEVRVPIPQDLIPGRPTVHLAEGKIILTATVSEIPGSLLDVANRSLIQGR